MSKQWISGMEVEELGMVALIGVILTPGVMWLAMGKTATSKIVRALVVGSVVAAAVAMERALDTTAESTGLIEGEGR